MPRKTADPREITLCFYIFGSQVNLTGNEPLIVIGVEGKQQWHRDIMPALKRALRELVGPPPIHRRDPRTGKYPEPSFYVDSLNRPVIDQANGKLKGWTTPAADFAHFSRKAGRLSIVIHPNHTHTIKRGTGS